MRLLACAFVMALAAPAQADDYNFGDRRLAPLEDPLRVEFPAGVAPGAEKLREVVASVAPSREWHVISQPGGRVQLERNVRDRHMLRVALDQDERGYSLRYLESVNLMYREDERYGKLRLIHHNYNVWVRELSSAIAGGLGINARPFAGYAPLDSVDAVPHLHAKGREGYAKFLASEKPRAFAVAPNGVWAFSTIGNRTGKRRENFDAIERALRRCNERADGQCQLYALDERVVWRAAQ